MGLSEYQCLVAGVLRVPKTTEGSGVLDERLVKTLKRRLTALRQRMRDQLAEMEAAMMDGPQSEWSRELSAYDNHPADSASETYHREQQIGLIDSRRRVLSMIDSVIAKMSDGTYGLCEQCKREIPAERLNAIPFALLCKECREAAEKQTVSHLRPYEESLIRDLFARLFSDGREFVGTDGEDTWQDIARHGTSETYQDVASTPDRRGATLTGSDDGTEAIEGTHRIVDEEEHGF